MMGKTMMSTMLNKSNRHCRSLLIGVLAMMSSACFSLNTYAPQSPDEGRPAKIIGDYRLRAGAAVNVFLRSVDDAPLRMWQHSANIDAGPHRLLVDCQVTATDKLSRHELNVTVESGVRYRLMADANDQQGCTRVSLEEIE